MRMVHVLNKEIHESRKALAVYAITITLVLFVVELVSVLVSKATWTSHMEIYEGMFPGFLFLGGFIVTSVFFSDDMFSKKAQHHWLMLPATSLEKFLSKALLCAIAYPLALIALFTATSAIGEAIILLFTRDPFVMFNPLKAYIWKMLLHYLVLQSIFLLGATYFRSAHFIKTVLALGVIFIAAGLFMALTVRIAFAPYIEGFFNAAAIRIVEDSNLSIERFGVLKTIFMVFYWALLAPFCWFTAYQRVKEVQSTDAVQ